MNDQVEHYRNYISVLEALLHRYRGRVMELERELGREPTGEPGPPIPDVVGAMTNPT